MTPEQEILVDLVAAIRNLRWSTDESLSMIHSVPADDAAFAALTPIERVATTAMLKQFEQLEDVLASLFRTMLKMLGVRLKGMFALDIGGRMAEIGVIDDASRWVAIVKLRNELVHEYPENVALRFERLRAAHNALPFLFDAAERAEHAIDARGLLKEAQ